jgi:hypothetical protein
MRRSTKNLSGMLLATMIVITGCSEPRPTTSPPDSELRLQIHAATGHEPPECTDFGDSDAEIEITADGFEPDCVMVSLGAVLTVSNNTDLEQRFIVGDPADSDVGRHIRVDEAIPSEAVYELDPVDALPDDEIYPFWLQGLQEDGFAGSLIVTP